MPDVDVVRDVTAACPPEKIVSGKFLPRARSGTMITALSPALAMMPQPAESTGSPFILTRSFVALGEIERLPRLEPAAVTPILSDRKAAPTLSGSDVAPDHKTATATEADIAAVPETATPAITASPRPPLPSTRHTPLARSTLAMYAPAVVARTPGQFRQHNRPLQRARLQVAGKRVAKRVVRIDRQRPAAA